MQAKSVKEVLIAMKWILENIGWCQGSNFIVKNTLERTDYFPKKELDSVCLLGALHAIETDETIRDNACCLLQNMVNGTGLSIWNDNSKRSKQQVLNLLDQAIERIK